MSRFIFPEWTETLKKWVSLLVLGAPVYLIALIAYGVTPEAMRIGYQPDQPVPYSHALHAGELGIDCRYCHTTVERAAKAAVPPAATCMNCHSHGARDESDRAAADPRRRSPSERAGEVDARPRPARLRLLQPHGARERGDRLRDVPRPHRSDGQGLPGQAADDGVVRRLPQQPRRRTSATRANVTKMGYESVATPHGRERAHEVAKKNDVHPPTNCSTCHR